MIDHQFEKNNKIPLSNLQIAPKMPLIFINIVLISVSKKRTHIVLILNLCNDSERIQQTQQIYNQEKILGQTIFDVITAPYINILVMNPESVIYPEYHFHAKQISVLNSILESVRQIAYFLQHSPIVKLETENKFGDQQLHQDVHCDGVVEKFLRKNPEVKGFASEERPHYEKIGEGDGYVVTYDPLDGSSIVDTNFAVGSIFSIWHTDADNLIGKKLKDQVNAVLAIYGPRTTVILYNPEVNKVQELSLLENKWILSHEHCVVAPKTKIFAPGNLRAASDNQAYHEAIQKWMSKGYTLRYTGGLVVDVSQIFIKGHGIFSAVASQKHKAKLRVLYEVGAVGFLIEKAEGKTITVGGISLLDYTVKTFDDRIMFAAGSQEEVDGLAHLFNV